MEIVFDDNGEPSFNHLTESEKREIFEKFDSALWDAESKWSSDYGPFTETVDVFGSSEEEISDKLKGIPDNLLWALVNYFEYSEKLEIVEGLVVTIKGWAYLPGRQLFHENENHVEHYMIASQAWDTSAPQHVYVQAECLCLFCRGQSSDTPCVICEGKGMWEAESR